MIQVGYVVVDQDCNQVDLIALDLLNCSSRLIYSLDCNGYYFRSIAIEMKEKDGELFEISFVTTKLNKETEDAHLFVVTLKN